jgi:hypothetical protein
MTHTPNTHTHIHITHIHMTHILMTHIHMTHIHLAHIHLTHIHMTAYCPGLVQLFNIPFVQKTRESKLFWLKEFDFRVH